MWHRKVAATHACAVGRGRIDGPWAAEASGSTDGLSASALLLAHYARITADNVTSLIGAGWHYYAVADLPAELVIPVYALIEAGDVPTGEFGLSLEVCSPTGAVVEQAHFRLTVETPGNPLRVPLYTVLNVPAAELGLWRIRLRARQRELAVIDMLVKPGADMVTDALPISEGDARLVLEVDAPETEGLLDSSRWSVSSVMLADYAGFAVDGLATIAGGGRQRVGIPYRPRKTAFQVFATLEAGGEPAGKYLLIVEARTPSGRRAERHEIAVMIEPAGDITRIRMCSRLDVVVKELGPWRISIGSKHRELASIQVLVELD